MNWVGVVLCALFAAVTVAVSLALIRWSSGARGGLRLAHVLGSVPVGLVVAGVVTLLAGRTRNEGPWECALCLTIEDRESLLGITIAGPRQSVASQTWGGEGRALARWYAEHRPDHEHQWRPTGCHLVAGGGYATYLPPLECHSVLDDLQDRELACEALEVLLLQPPADQRAHAFELRRRLTEAKRAGGIDERAIVEAWRAGIPAGPR